MLGYCKECESIIREEYSLKDMGYKNIYECPKCGYPSTIEDLVSFKLTKDLLNKRICDVEGVENTQTYLEFVRESEMEFCMDEANFDYYTDDELNVYFNFLNELWCK